MPNKLTGLSVREVSGVDRAANKRKFLLTKADAPTKTEQGQNFTAADYAYVPDAKDPSTWKLRLVESPGAKPTAAQVGRAIAALGKGFRGQKVSIPPKDMAKVKRKVLAAWRATHPGETDIPSVLKGDTEMAKQNALAALVKAINPFKKADLPDGAQALLDQLLEAAGDEGDSPDLLDYVQDEQDDATLEEICDGLYEALDAIQDAEGGDKRAAVEAVLEQLGALLASQDFLKDAGVLKAGRKISASNQSLIQTAIAALQQLAQQAGGQQQDQGQQGDGSGADGDTGNTDVSEEDDEEDGAGMPMGKAKREAKKAEREKKRAARKEKDMQKSAEVVSLEKQVERLQADVRKEQEIRKKAELTTLVKGIGGVPGLTTDEMVDTLMKADAATAKVLEKSWRASAETLRKSGLLDEFGKGGQGGGASAEQQLIVKAQELAKSEKISFGDAMSLISKQDPTLYAEYEQQRKGA